MDTDTHRPVMVTDTHRPAMVTDTGLGMDARLAGRFRVETARPIRDRAGVVFRLVPGIGGSKLSAALPPILFGFTLHRWHFRIFDLDPKRRTA